MWNELKVEKNIVANLIVRYLLYTYVILTTKKKSKIK